MSEKNNNNPTDLDLANSSTASELAELHRLVEARRDEAAVDAAPSSPRLAAAMLEERIAAFSARTADPALVAKWDEQDRQEKLDADRREVSGFYDTLLSCAGSAFADRKFYNYEISSPAQETAVNSVREYSATLPERIANREGLLLFGPVGTGKDHLLFSAAREAVVRHRVPVRWVTGERLYTEIRDGMDGSKSERAVLSPYLLGGVLVISDPLPPFGDLGQHMAFKLCGLLSERIDAGRVTWVSLNVADDREAMQRMGVPTWNRMQDRVWKILCRWESYRKPTKRVNC